MENKKYNENTIKTLSARDFCRLRPGVYIGSNEDTTQLVKEIFSNALDEHTSNRGNTINVIIDTKLNKYTVEDFGQGFKINTIKPDTPEHTILQSAFEDFNTSGKYDDDGCYSGSLGCNGQGAKCTNFLSLFLEVISYDANGNYEQIFFKDGLFDRRQLGKDITHQSGTIVSWTPDPQFFQNSEANISDLKKLFEEISALCPALTINFTIDINKITYHTQNGIADLVDKKVGNKEILNNRFQIRKEASQELFDIVITYTSDYSDNIIAYANYGLTDSGVHISLVKAAITYQINKYAKDNNFLKKNDDFLTQAELAEGLFIIFNIKTTNVKYDSQTKTRITDINKTLITNTINDDFAIWLVNNPKDAKIIIDKALLARKARAAAAKAKEGIRNAGTKGKKFISLPTKLVDCYDKKRETCELFITEGDSAAANLIAKRDGKNQAIFPIRGKVLSCRKASTDKIYANQEISNIVKAIGLDIDKTTGKLIYDAKKLRYGKIILAADGDVDGKNIVSLLINMFWELCKELIINGHIHVALPPLFKITTAKNEYIFLRDEKALIDYKKKHQKEKYLVQRSKGLGEMDASEIKYCLLDKISRNVQQIIVDNEKSADELLECFFGNDVSVRRKYLLDHASEANAELKIY